MSKYQMSRVAAFILGFVQIVASGGLTYLMLRAMNGSYVQSVGAFLAEHQGILGFLIGATSLVGCIAAIARGHFLWFISGAGMALVSLLVALHARGDDGQDLSPNMWFAVLGFSGVALLVHALGKRSVHAA